MKKNGCVSRTRLFLLFYVSLRFCLGDSSCYRPATIDFSLRQEYHQQPIFGTFVTKSELFQLLDNICFTYFPLPDDPNTFTLYQARVFCDGSFDVQTYVATVIGTGHSIVANAFNTFHDYIIGYAGCDTYILYTCTEFGVSKPFSFIAGLSPNCNPIGLSCLRKVEEVISNSGLPETDFYVLPMKLPNRCVTQQLCQQPPNPFYNTAYCGCLLLWLFIESASKH